MWAVRDLPETGEEWRALRAARDLSRAELARRATLDPVTVWRLENDRPVAESTRRLVAAALGLPVFEGAAA